MAADPALGEEWKGRQKARKTFLTTRRQRHVCSLTAKKDVPVDTHLEQESRLSLQTNLERRNSAKKWRLGRERPLAGSVTPSRSEMLLPPTGTSFLSRDQCGAGGQGGDGGVGGSCLLCPDSWLPPVGRGHRIRLSVVPPGTIFPLLPPRGPTVFSPSNHTIGLGAFCFRGSMGRAPEEMGGHQLPGDVTPGRDLVESVCVSPTGTAGWDGNECGLRPVCTRQRQRRDPGSPGRWDGWPRRSE